MNISKFNVKFIAGLIYIIASTIVLSCSIKNYEADNIKTQATTQVPTTTQEQTTTQPETTTTQPLPQVLTIRLECYSVKNDLKIKFINEQTREYITGSLFNVTVTDPSGNQKAYSNKDLKGYIYVSGLKSGNYTVKLTVPEGFLSSVDTVNVKVKDKVEYKPITDIKDKVVPTINTNEDGSHNKDMENDNTLKDTVEFVKTDKIVIPQQINYLPVEYANVKAPETTQPASTDAPQITQLSVSNTPSSTESNQLFDVDGNKLYILVGNNYVLATRDDYIPSNKFYKQEIIPESYKYTGWQTIDGKTYYYDKNGNYVTGNQIINGARFSFGNDGVLAPGYGVLGIDVSKYQGKIDWKAVKASGVQFVIIRVGVRGCITGNIVEDQNFDANIRGAQAAGLDVGIYFFSQAINEVEAVEEASACISFVKNYKIKYPVFIDTEKTSYKGTPGRANSLTTEQRTAVCKAFCETVKNSGYKAGIYASKDYFTNHLYTSQLNQYTIWLAQWANKPTYGGRYDMWQYSDKGSISGISGNVDINLSYMTF